MESYGGRRTLIVLASAGVVLLAGCSGEEAARPSAVSAPAVPFSIAGSIAAPEHAAVQGAVSALATAEQRLSREMAPWQGDTFGTYLQGLAGASQTTRRSVEQIARRGGDCGRVNSAVTAATAGVTGALDSAMSRFNGRAFIARETMQKIDSDRAAVAKAAANLKTALANDPDARQIPGVDETGATLAGIAKWQLSLANAISAAQRKASSYPAIRSQVFAHAAALRESCSEPETREHARAPERASQAAAATRPAAPTAFRTEPAPSTVTPPRPDTTSARPVPATTSGTVKPPPTSPKPNASEPTSPDSTSPDTTSPDTTSPDTTSPDSPSPDSPSPDTTSPDSPSPDTTSPDSHSPDSHSPDSHSPDSHIPEPPASGSTASESTSPAAYPATEAP